MPKEITPEDRERGARFKALRERLGLKQHQVVALDPLGELRQAALSRLETGWSKAQGIAVLGHVARAYRVTIDDLSAYGDDRISLDELLALRAGETVRRRGPRSLAHLPEGATLDDVPEALRPLLMGDALPEDCWPAIPSLMALPFAVYRHFKTSDAWAEKARELLIDESHVRGATRTVTAHDEPLEIRIRTIGKAKNYPKAFVDSCVTALAADTGLASASNDELAARMVDAWNADRAAQGLARLPARRSTVDPGDEVRARRKEHGR